MNKKRNRFSIRNIMSVLAVICALMLVVEVLPLQTVLTISSFAGQNSKVEKTEEEKRKERLNSSCSSERKGKETRNSSDIESSKAGNTKPSASAETGSVGEAAKSTASSAIEPTRAVNVKPSASAETGTTGEAAKSTASSAAASTKTSSSSDSASTQATASPAAASTKGPASSDSASTQATASPAAQATKVSASSDSASTQATASPAAASTKVSASSGAESTRATASSAAQSTKASATAADLLTGAVNTKPSASAETGSAGEASKSTESASASPDLISKTEERESAKGEAADGEGDKKEGEPESDEEKEEEGKNPLVKVIYPVLDASHVLDKKAYYKSAFEPVLAVSYEDAEAGVEPEDLECMEYAILKDQNQAVPGEDDWIKFDSKEIVLSFVEKTEDHVNDGEYRIFVRGSDQSGTPLKVAEYSFENRDYSRIVDTADEVFIPEYTLVLDTTAPKAVIDIDDKGASRPDLNTRYGNRFYFNKKHTAKISISEKNLKIDESGGIEVADGRVKVSYAEKAADDFEDSSTAAIEDKDFKTVVKQDAMTAAITYDRGNETADFLFKADKGVIQYLVKGQDLAGNQLEYEKNDEKYFETPERTYPIVTDTDMPEMSVTVETISGAATDQNKAALAFEMRSDGSIPASDRYQKADRAIVTAKLVSPDESTDAGGSQGAEKTPYTLYYDVVVRTEGEKTTAYSTEKYEVKNKLVTTITAPEDLSASGNSSASGTSGASASSGTTDTVKRRACVIRVQGFYAEDLAGNRVGSSGENILKTLDIFLDSNAPQTTLTDDFAPMITICPSASGGKYGVGGTPLYNADLSIRIVVRDPFGPLDPKGTDDEKKSRGSTGLKKVNCALSNHEGPIEKALKNYDDGKLFSFTRSAEDDDSSLVYEQEWTGENSIVIKAEDANYNSLVFAVTAEDNAGNSATAEYRFGIDITPPEITLAYDNNSCKNGFYFNKGRVATLTVKERNFSPDEFEVNITGETCGSDVNGAGSFTETDWKKEPGTSPNGDDDKYIRTIEFDHDGVYTVSIGSGSSSENDHDESTAGSGSSSEIDHDESTTGSGSSSENDHDETTTGSGSSSEIDHDESTIGSDNMIFDHAGNTGYLSYEGQKAPFAFVIDRTAPNVSIHMDVRSGGKNGVRLDVETPDEDGSYYYRADNCGITVLYDDNGFEFAMKGAGNEYSVTVDGREDDARKALVLQDFSFWDIKAGKSGYRGQQKIAYSARELAQGESRLLADGAHTITVTAVDAAGNRADRKCFIKNSGGCALDQDRYSGEFVLDTVRPLVAKIITRSAGSTAGQKYPVTDNKVYSDTKCVYYNKNIKVRIDVRDKNIRPGLASGSMYKESDSARKPSVIASVSQTDSGVSAVYTLTGDHKYTNLTLTGADKAGNLLLLVDEKNNKDTYIRDSASEADRLVQSSSNSGKGTVALKYGKIVDRTPPQAKILYDSADYANMYREGGDKEKARAYYNKPVKVRISFSDNYHLDGEKLFAGDLDEDKALGAIGTCKACDLPVISITEDSRRRFTAYGRDRALNPAEVSEMIPFTDSRHKERIYVTSEAGAFNEKLTVRKAYTPRYQIIVDRTPPAFTLDIKSEKSVNQAMREGRYFFNQGYTATIRIDEKNFDASRIGLRRGSITDNSTHYNTRAVVLDASDLDQSIAVRERTVTDSNSGNGVYRYLIYGSDKAGNALVPSGKDNLDGTAKGTDRKSGDYVDGLNNEKDRGSLEKEANLSVHITLDNIAPAGTLKITAHSADTGSGADDTDRADRNTVSAGSVNKGESGNEKNEKGESEKGKSGNEKNEIGESEKGESGNEKNEIGENEKGKSAKGGGSKAVYEMDIDGNVTFAEPYREETNAGVSIEVCEEIERSPVSISYRIDSTSSSDAKTVIGKEYKYNNRVSAVQNGQQIFRVAEYTFTDLAGNSRTYTAQNRIYLDRTAPLIDEIAPAISVVARAKPGTNAYVNGRELFGTDVPLSIKVSDPDPGKSSSGLADITYALTDLGKACESGILRKKNDQTFLKNYRDQELVFSINKTVSVDAHKYNSNDIGIIVTATDNAGNRRTAEYHFGIDTVRPTVRVTYDNNSAMNGEFFKADRVATVQVTERNFESSKFHITTESGASVGAWSYESGGGNGDRDTWTAKVTYARDGSYTLRVSGEDMLGNQALEREIEYEGTAPRKFTIDKTPPGVTVTYDNNDAANEKYYKASRTASILVEDVNFAGVNDILVEAAGGAAAPPVVFNGNRADLFFQEDGIYGFEGTVTDQAGNITAIPAQKEFVIDTRAPVLRFDSENPFKVIKARDAEKSDMPIDNQFFTSEQFTPRLTVIDTNCSTAASDAVLKIDGTKEENHFIGKIGPLGNSGTQFEISLSPDDFNVEKSRDDVYHLTAYAVDLAGNRSELIEFDFSLNRFGSNFKAADDYTEQYIRGQYYHSRTDQDLLIHEYNTNQLKTDAEKIELITNGNTASRRTLVKGEEYELKEDLSMGSGRGGRIYLYTIRNSVFEKEGDYSFWITSVDESGHINSTSQVYTGEKKQDGNLKVTTFPIDFVVDKTPPVNELAGVSSQIKQTFNRSSLQIDIHPEDAQTAVERVEIRRWESGTDLFGNPLTPRPGETPAEVRTYAYYGDIQGASDTDASFQERGLKPAETDSPLQEMGQERTDTDVSTRESGQKPSDTETAFFEDLSQYADPVTGKIVINYRIEEKKDWQVVEIITTDSAGNKSVDIREGGQDGAPEARREFLVTTDTFTRLVNSRAVRIGTAGAALLLLLFLLLFTVPSEL